jgi:hypothetical protein
MRQAPRKFSTIPGIMACLVLVMHVLLAAIVVVSPDVSKGSKVFTFYRRLIVLGPFFQEPRITSSPHVFVSYYVSGAWTPGKDEGCESVAASASQYGVVKRRAFEEYLAFQVGRRQPVRLTSRAALELENYLGSRERAMGADSIAVAYVVRQGMRDAGGAHIDTVYHFKFKP